MESISNNYSNPPISPILDNCGYYFIATLALATLTAGLYSLNQYTDLTGRISRLGQFIASSVEEAIKKIFNRRREPPAPVLPPEQREERKYLTITDGRITAHETPPPSASKVFQIVDQEPPKEIKVVNPKQAMLDTLGNIWNEATLDETSAIQVIWLEMIKGAKVQKWESKGNNQYVLKVERKVVGSIPNVPFTFIFPQEMNLQFSEREGQKILTFPNNTISVVQRNFLVDIPLASLKEIRLQGREVVVEGKFPGGFTQSQELTTDLALVAWQMVNWTE